MRKREAAGRHSGSSSPVTASTTEGAESEDPLSSFLDAQLGAAVAKCKLHKEQELLSKTSKLVLDDRIALL